MAEHSSPLVQGKATCPHCWETFYADEAMYISRHAELYGDPVLGDHENRRYAPQEIHRDRNGDAQDPKGWKMTERACPNCHLQIPIELLLKPPNFISVVGAPRSGKTYFITSMLHHLRHDLAKYFAMSLQASDSHDVKAFVEYERTLFGAADPSLPTALQKTQEQGALYNIVRLDNVDVQLPKPFIFTLRPTEANPDLAKQGQKIHRNVVLYDNAGESFDFLKEKAGNIRVTQHLSHCDAVLFAYDPLQHPDARVRLANCSRDPQITAAAVTNRQESILEEVINRMRRHRPGTLNERLAPPLVVCVQKYDVWQSLVPRVRDGSGAETNTIDHTSVVYSRTHGIAGLDIGEINLISIQVRAFLNDLSPEFVTQAEANFEVVRYFPVSALGTSPQFESSADGVAGNQLLKVRPADIRPFRVEHPMLWLLHRWKIIREARLKSNAAQLYPHATVESIAGGRLRVVSPLTKWVMVLDREYAGSAIVDPEAGSFIWIPEINPINVQAAHAPAPAPASQPPPLKLGQPEAPKPPKRGWFS